MCERGAWVSGQCTFRCDIPDGSRVVRKSVYYNGENEGQRGEGVGVVKDKEIKLEDVEALHALGGSSYTTRYTSVHKSQERGTGRVRMEKVSRQ
jgi:hypothetical protein